MEIEKYLKNISMQQITVRETESGTVMLNWDSRYLCHFSTKWLKFGLQAHLFKMFGHAKFQLSISCSFSVMKHLVEITKNPTQISCINGHTTRLLLTLVPKSMVWDTYCTHRRRLWDTQITSLICKKFEFFQFLSKFCSTFTSTKSFITLKVQEIESWNFACPNILKRCGWTPNFSHFGWEMTKISTVPVQHRCPTFSIGHCNNSHGRVLHGWVW